MKKTRVIDVNQDQITVIWDSVGNRHTEEMFVNATQLFDTQELMPRDYLKQKTAIDNLKSLSLSTAIPTDVLVQTQKSNNSVWVHYLVALDMLHYLRAYDIRLATDLIRRLSVFGFIKKADSQELPTPEQKNVTENA